MQLHIYDGIKEGVYSIKEIHFAIDDNNVPVDIEICAEDDVLDTIEKDFWISSTERCDGKRAIFVGRMPRFELK